MRKTELISKICKLNALTKQFTEFEMLNYRMSTNIYENITKEWWQAIIDHQLENIKKINWIKKDFEILYKEIVKAIIENKLK